MQGFFIMSQSCAYILISAGYRGLILHLSDRVYYVLAPDCIAFVLNRLIPSAP